MSIELCAHKFTQSSSSHISAIHDVVPRCRPHLLAIVGSLPLLGPLARTLPPHHRCTESMHSRALLQAVTCGPTVAGSRPGCRSTPTSVLDLITWTIL